MREASHILVVDDDPALLLATSSVLRKAGYIVIHAKSGEEGIQLALTHKPELILLDVVMPDIDGRELCQRLKSYPTLSRTLIVLLSSLQTDPQELEVGADGYIARPIANRELLARVKTFLRLQTALVTCNTLVEDLQTANNQLEEQVQISTAQLQMELHKHKIAEEKLSDSEGHYRTLFENMVQGAFIQRADGAVVDCNPAVLEMFGLTRDQLFGKTSMDPYWRVVREDGSDFPGAEHPSMEALRSGMPVMDVVAGVFNPKKMDYVWLTINAIPMFRAGEDQPYQVFVTLHDFTERKKAEQRFQDTTILLTEAQKVGQFGSWNWHLKTNEMWWSDSLYEIFGRDPTAGIPPQDNYRWLETVYPDDQEAVKQSVDNAIASWQPYEVQYRIRRENDGEIRILASRGKPILSENGEPERLLGVVQDITDRKKAEDALAESEKNLETLFDTLSEGVALNEMIFNDQGEMIDYRILKVNPAFYTIATYNGSGVIGNVATRLYGISSDFIKAFWQDHRDKTTVAHTEMWSPLKHKCYYISISPFAEGQFVTSFFDITEMKDGQELLKKSEQELKQAQRVSHVGNWTWYIVTNRLLWSDEMYRIFGIDKDDFTGDLADVMLTAIHPDDRAAVAEANSRVIEEGKPIPIEYRVIHPDGTVRTVWAEAGELIPDSSGNPAVLTGIVQDITDRRLAEEALREREEKYRLLFENMMNGFALHEIVLDAQGKPVDYIFLDANTAFEQLTGIVRDDLIGKRVTEILPGTIKDPADWIGRYGKVTLTGQPSRFEAFSQDIGKWFSVLAFSPSKNHFATLFEDISERKHAEEEIRKLNAELEESVLQRTTELARTSERLDLATGAARVGIWEWDIVHNILTCG